MLKSVRLAPSGHKVAPREQELLYAMPFSPVGMHALTLVPMSAYCDARHAVTRSQSSVSLALMEGVDSAWRGAQASENVAQPEAESAPVW